MYFVPGVGEYFDEGGLSYEVEGEHYLEDTVEVSYHVGTDVFEAGKHMVLEDVEDWVVFGVLALGARK